MRKQPIQIATLFIVLIAFSAVAFSFYSHASVVLEEASCKQETQKSSEMIFEKLVKQFVGAVSL